MAPNSCICLTTLCRSFASICQPQSSYRTVCAALLSSHTQDSPLAGVKILDMTRILAGPYCTMMLADLGATVFKIEKPGAGDDTRAWGPPFLKSSNACDDDAKNNNSLYFMSVNRNKQSVAVNIKHASGQQIIRQLAQRCDVLVENFLPGTLDELGIGYDELKQTAPHLIYCSITGYGNDGPYRNKPGYDVIAEGEGGMLHITGPENGEPCKIGTAMTDLATGLYAHGAIIAALFQRDRQPPHRRVGQRIECNLLSTQVAQLVNIGVNFLNTGVEPRRMGTSHGAIVPYQAFRTADKRYLVIGAGNDAQFKLLCRKLNADELMDDKRFSTNRLRVANRDILIKKLTEIFSSATLDEWLHRLGDIAMPYGPVNDLEHVFKHPQIVHNKMVLELEHSKYGSVRVMNSPVKMKHLNESNHRAPPTLGEHTVQVLRNELNYSSENIERLMLDKVIA